MQTPTTWIKSTATLTPNGFVERATVQVASGQVVGVWAEGEAPAPQSADQVLDLGAQLVLPGFVNTHTHAAMNLLRGFSDDLPLDPWLKEHVYPAEARLQPGDIGWGTKAALLEMIASGITTFVDMYFALDEVAAATRESGIRGVLGRGLVTVGGRGQEALAEACDFHRRMQGSADGRITTWLAPHAPYTTTPEFLEEVGQAARALGTGVHIHLSETKREVAECQAQYGVSPFGLMRKVGLDRQPLLAAHAVHLTDDDLASFAQWKPGIAHNPISNLKMGCGMAPVAQLLALDMPLGLGTDGVASANSLDFFLTMKASIWGARGMTGDPSWPNAEQILRAASWGGARAVGLDQVTGAIAPGLAADLIGVSLTGAGLEPVHDRTSALVYSATAAAVKTVLVNGKLVYQDGAFLTLDQEAILAHAAEISRRLVAVN
jgi:5-methylthioadenosine/S-adenosylhomocysteine deaminase